MLGLAYPTLLTATYFLALADSPTLVQQFVYGGGKVVQFALPMWWAFRLPAVRWRPFRPSAEGLLYGLLFGVVVGISMWWLFRVAIAETPTADQMRGVILGKLRGFRITSPMHYAALSLFYCLLHSGLEEYYWRWFVHRSCRQHMDAAATAGVVSSLGFAAHHVLLLATFLGWTSPWTWICSAGVAVGGFFWAWLYDRANKITAPWISHMLVDVAVFAIGFTLVGRDLN